MATVVSRFEKLIAERDRIEAQIGEMFREHAQALEHVAQVVSKGAPSPARSLASFECREHNMRWTRKPYYERHMKKEHGIGREAKVA